MTQELQNKLMAGFAAVAVTLTLRITTTETLPSSNPGALSQRPGSVSLWHVTHLLFTPPGLYRPALFSLLK